MHKGMHRDAPNYSRVTHSHQNTTDNIEGCPILRQIYAWHCIVLSSHYNTVQKHNNKERSKTMTNLTNACINLSEYWTSMTTYRITHDFG